MMVENMVNDLRRETMTSLLVMFISHRPIDKMRIIWHITFKSHDHMDICNAIINSKITLVFKYSALIIRVDV